MKKNSKKFIAVLAALGIVTGTAGSSVYVSAKADKKYNVENGILTSYEGSSKVYIRDNVSAIGMHTFDDDNVTQFVVDSGNKYFKAVDGVLYTKDGKRLVRYPSGRKGSFTVPDTVTYIAQYAFMKCTKLSGVNIPSSVKGIGANAFYECKNLESINIPDGIDKIAKYTFYECRSLKNIVLPDGIKSIGSAAFYGCKSLSRINLPSSIEKIKDEAFHSCSSLKDISIPENVRKIEIGTFSRCTDLESVTLNNNIEKISNGAFEYCTSLKAVSIPDSTDEIGIYAFQKCESLEKVALPEGIEAVNYGTFKGCTSLNEIKLPESIRYIYQEAFKKCVSLQTVHIPEKTEMIKGSAFTNAAAAFTVDSENTNFSANDGVLYNKMQTELLKYPCYKSGSYTMPDGVKKISSYAFRGCKRLDNVTVSEGIKNFPKSCLTDSSVKRLSLPESLCKISDINIHKPKNAINLKAVTVPETNTKFCSVDGLLYSKDKKILYIYPNGKTGTVKFAEEVQDLSAVEYLNKASAFEIPKSSKSFTTDDGMVTNLKRNKVLFVPAAKTSYTLGSSIKNIDVINDAKQYMDNFKSYKVSNGNQNYRASDGVLYSIDGEKLIDYPSAKAGSYKTPLSVTSVFHRAFAYSHNIKNITITKNVLKCDLALSGCSSLKDIVVKEGNLRKVKFVLHGDTKLKSATFPSSIVSCNIDLAHGHKARYMVINGWTNTVSEKLAIKLGAKFNSMGLVPNKVKGVKARAYIHDKRVRITWKRDAQASGYEIYTDNERLKDIKDNKVNKADIYIGSSAYNVLYIRAYKIQNGKKMYGKAKKIVYIPYF